MTREFWSFVPADTSGPPLRYLAAYSPTVRAQGQAYRVAWRLHRGERLFEEATAV